MTSALAILSTATGIRTRVSAMRGRRPSPLDDSGAQLTEARLAKRSGRGPARRAGWPKSGSGVPSLSSPSRLGAISSHAHQHADVAELVDAHGSGPCPGNWVEVRVLSSALSKGLRKGLFVVV